MSGGIQSTLTSYSQLSARQQQVCDTWGEGLAVSAGAGAGKTTTLTIKVEKLLERDPRARFVAVSFTEKSASDLEAKLAQRLSVRGLHLHGEGGPLSGHWVMTIHGLCSAIIREFPREAGLDGQEGMLSEGEARTLWNRAIEGLWRDSVSEPVSRALDHWLARESPADLVDRFITRSRDLWAYGLEGALADSGVTSEDAAHLNVLVRDVLERYERMKRRQGMLDFNDLERLAHRVLQSEVARQAYHKRFDLVMIDEFQDTNPLQADILWNFARPKGTNLVVVGDPKQSIYRFRDADVSVFDERCRTLPRRISLTENRRSRPGIIDFVNETCAPLFEPGGIAYEALDPKREAREDGLAPVERLEVDDPRTFGLWLRDQVKKGHSLGDFALLLRRVRGDAPARWLQGLIRAGIPVAVGSGGMLWDDPRARELTAFLRWWHNPSNRLSGATFLRAPWVGVADGEIDEWVRRDSTLVEPFFSSGHPLALALAPLRGRPLTPGELIRSLLLDEGMERELGQVALALWHRAEQLSADGADFQAVVEEFSDRVDNSARDRDVPPPRGQGQLLVLSIHGSKGLEFPHVVLVDFPENPVPKREYPMLFWHRRRGVHLAVRDAFGDRDKEHPLEREWRAFEMESELDETRRVFYVALTRARERLLLVQLPPKKAAAEASASGEPASPEKKSRPREKKEVDSRTRDHWRAWISIAGQVPLQTFEAAHFAGVAAADGAALPSVAPRTGTGRPAFVLPDWRRDPSRLVRPRHSVTEWSKLALCPRLYEWRIARPRLPAREGIPQLGLFSGKAEKTAADVEVDHKELGTRVHACLEFSDWDGLAALEREVGERRFRAEPVVSWALSSPLMLPESSGGAGDDGVHRVWSELAFEVKAGGSVLVGSMDRVVRAGARDWHVVDFKITSRTREEEELVSLYHTQLKLYAWALGRMDPSARWESGATLRASLIQISPDGVDTIEVPLPETDDQLDKHASSLEAEASKILSGTAGAAKPGAHCRSCEFRGACDAAARLSKARR